MKTVKLMMQKVSQELLIKYLIQNWKLAFLVFLDGELFRVITGLSGLMKIINGLLLELQIESTAGF